MIAVRPSASSATAASSPTPAGTSISPSASTAASSAYPPDPPVADTTRRPISPSSTSGPTAATTPPTPLPGMTGNSPWNGPKPVARNWVSTKVMLANATSTSACPLPADGAATSSATSTSGGPNPWSRIARIPAA
jgi:hypothetical protein